MDMLEWQMVAFTVLEKLLWLTREHVVLMGGQYLLHSRVCNEVTVKHREYIRNVL